MRSSAADEDGAQASFAGQHLTLLNVPSADALVAALKEIWWSANSDSAITYRQRVGLFTRPSVGVVVQKLLNPEAAGVMFTLKSGHRGRRAGDRSELGPRRSGRRRAGDPGPFPARPFGRSPRAKAGLKQIAIRSAPNGGTIEETVAEHLVEALCLGDDELDAARPSRGPVRRRCTARRATSNGRSRAATLYLLQCRAITRE